MNFNAEIEVDLKKLKYNVKTLKDTYGDYSFMIANLKNNAFGMGYDIIDTLVQNGVNYLYVSTLKEALDIRKINTEIPILISNELDNDYLYDAIMSNITITISNLEILRKISLLDIKDELKLHILVDNGSNKMGLKSIKEVSEAIDIINASKFLSLEGIYTDIPTYGVLDEDYYREMATFLEIIASVDVSDLIIHANEPIMYHKKEKDINGIRYDLSLLGIEENIDDGIISSMRIKNIEKKYNNLTFPNIDLSLIFAISAKVMSLSEASKGTLIGRNYIAKEDMHLAIIPIGHKDGITKALGNVMINKEVWPIVADEIDHLIIEVPSNTKVGDTVYLINEDTDIYSVIGLLRTNRFYLMSILNNNLKRSYLNYSEGDSIL